MISFKCLQSGNVYGFTAEHDIASMRLHPDYVEVVEVEKPCKPEPVKAPKKEAK